MDPNGLDSHFVYLWEINKMPVSYICLIELPQQRVIFKCLIVLKFDIMLNGCAWLIKATNMYYYKYKVFGMSVIMVNLYCLVPAGLVVGYAPGMSATLYGDLAITIAAIIPLSYTIGMAISCIAAQSKASCVYMCCEFASRNIRYMMYENEGTKGSCPKLQRSYKTTMRDRPDLTL